jgi:hypothetical protein
VGHAQGRAGWSCPGSVHAAQPTHAAGPGAQAYEAWPGGSLRLVLRPARPARSHRAGPAREEYAASCAQQPPLGPQLRDCLATLRAHLGTLMVEGADT